MRSAMNISVASSGSRRPLNCSAIGNRREVGGPGGGGVGIAVTARSTASRPTPNPPQASPPIGDVMVDDKAAPKHSPGDLMSEPSTFDSNSTIGESVVWLPPPPLPYPGMAAVSLVGGFSVSLAPCLAFLSLARSLSLQLSLCPSLAPPLSLLLSPSSSLRPPLSLLSFTLALSLPPSFQLSLSLGFGVVFGPACVFLCIIRYF